MLHLIFCTFFIGGMQGFLEGTASFRFLSGFLKLDVNPLPFQFDFIQFTFYDLGLNLLLFNLSEFDFIYLQKICLISMFKIGIHLVFC